ncbi:uncharacterized protein METZ01_LOCUS155766 [marine metagenome]|uniref:Uncharacterized protein n=1 Tax=marine metagenome TaxID=408172 RepID=A0A382AP60_9ZZZZ
MNVLLIKLCAGAIKNGVFLWEPVLEGERCLLSVISFHSFLLAHNL